MKKLICLLLAVIAILPLSACGKSTGERVTNVFRSEEVELPEGFSPQKMYPINGGYALTEVDRKERQTRIVRLTKNGTDFNIASDEIIDEIISYAAFLPDGDIVYTTSQDNLCRRGSKNISVPESEVIGGGIIVYLVIDAEGNIFLASQFSAAVVDSEFNKIFTPLTNGTINDVFLSDDGKIYLDSYDKYNGSRFYGYVDVAQKKLVQVQAMNVTDRKADFCCAADGKIWFKNLSGIYALAEEEINIVCDFLNSDLVPSKVGDVIPEDSEHIAMLYDNRLMMLTHVPDDQVKPRKLIKVAGTEISAMITDKAAEFNRTHPEYRISLYDYSIYSDADAKLRNDIIAGKTPDIMYLSINDRYREEYIDQKLFTDLWKIIDADESFDRSDIIPGTLKSCERSGELYEIPTWLSLDTLTIKTSNLPETSRPGSWTLREFLDWAKSLECTIPVEATQTELLFYMIRCSDEEFIDYEKGKCSFDSELFRETLEFAKNCNTDVRTVLTSNETNSSRSYKYSNDKIMLFKSWSDELRIFRISTALRIFRTPDTTYIGFPDSDGNGLALKPVRGFAITAKSEVKEAAWEFIKELLSEVNKAQEFIEVGQFTSMRSMIKRVFEERADEVYVLDLETGDDDYIFADKFNAADYPPDKYITYYFSEEEAEKMIALFDGAGTSLSEDSTLWSIIKEDAEMYFAGAKSLDETVKIIQDRAETFIAEQN